MQWPTTVAGLRAYHWATTPRTHPIVISTFSVECAFETPLLLLEKHCDLHLPVAFVICVFDLWVLWLSVTYIYHLLLWFVSSDCCMHLPVALVLDGLVLTLSSIQCWRELRLRRRSTYTATWPVWEHRETTWSRRRTSISSFMMRFSRQFIRATAKYRLATSTHIFRSWRSAIRVTMLLALI